MSAAHENDHRSNPYPDGTTRPDFPEIERGILDRWARDDTFTASVELRDGGENEYVFNDGPPFANGLPHYGHLLTGYVKDVIPRYQTMRGHKVERRFGWDCHGLPAEMETEKQLGIAGHKQISEYGIENFNDACRTSVLRYTAEWERYVSRMARWVDFDNDYKTLDTTFMESVIWAFKELWDKGLIYQAYRVMPYSWGAETPLSNFEIRLDDATRPRQDPAVTVRFELERLADDPGPIEIWAWTTTPWTLPSNLALAVGPEVSYDLVRRSDGSHVVVGSAAGDRYSAQLGEGAVTIRTMNGSEIAGRTYVPLFDYFAPRDNCFVVLADGYVTDEDGTGVVHMAPGFGEDDQRVCEAAGIELVVPVDDAGRFTHEVSDWEGINVFDANPGIIAALKNRGDLIRHDTYDHNYPHCWRTDTPIIYKAVSSWFVRVTELVDRLVAVNQGINWIPEHVRDGQFGRWLEGARDWSISRNRFWGSPIPIWQSDDPEYPRTDVYGSIAELETDFGVVLDDLHRPTIDNLVRPNPDDPTGESMMRRVPEVLDCWFESGSMPFAQAHYPFENKDWFDTHNPADFIVEYIAQTRGWFYTMHVLSVALFDRPAFSNVICHGVVLDHEGRKLSKKLRNYPDPEHVFESIGADPLRWYLMASPILRGGDLRIQQDGAGIADVVRLVINPIWNVYSFFCRYANIDGYTAKSISDPEALLDRYILAKTRELVDAVTRAMDAYDIAGACHQITAFIDALNNWWIRRSRERFWAPGTEESGDMSRDKTEAYDTLYTVLDNLLRVAAPLLPMITEEMFTGLTEEKSVHLVDWPDASRLPLDDALVTRMDAVRATCSAALGLREDNSLRTRLPLMSLTVAGDSAPALADLADLIKDEVNVRHVVITADTSGIGDVVLKPNSRVLGPRLGGAVQEVLRAAREGEWTQNDDGTVSAANETLDAGEYEISMKPIEGTAAASVKRVDPEGKTIDLGLVAVLDTNVTAELEGEGTARDVIRLVQQARKEQDLFITDRIELSLAVNDEIGAALAAHNSSVASAVLATTISVSGEAEATPEMAPLGTVGAGDVVGLLRVAER